MGSFAGPRRMAERPTYGRATGEWAGGRRRAAGNRRTPAPRSRHMRHPLPPCAYPLRGQHGRVVHTLGTLIAGGDLAPGEPLPTEEELVGELGVGRSALREAMKVLGGKGLVESRTRAGTRVRPREAWHLIDPDVLGWRYQASPTLADLE